MAAGIDWNKHSAIAGYLALLVAVLGIGIALWLGLRTASGPGPGVQSGALPMNQWALLSAAALFMVGVIVAAVLHWMSRDQQRVRPHAPRPFGDIALVERQLADTQRQIVALSRFEIFALWKLLLTDGMTGRQFYFAVLDLGFPVLTLEQQNAIQDTFEGMSGKVTFLDCIADVWKVKADFSGYVQYVVDVRLSPIFGI